VNASDRKWWNIARFVARDPARMPVLLKKVMKRVRGESVRGSKENDQWIEKNTKSAEYLAKQIDSDLWNESVAFSCNSLRIANEVLNDIPYDLGGGSHYAFLYWLTRYKKPRVVVETGVAAGWSSRAFLTAMERNRRGTLYSSDFPYFRLPNPESFVGVLVEEELRERWVLHLDSDEVNLPRILDTVEEIDLFHYDSDKTASGRQYAVDAVREKLVDGGLIVMDDISDDDWFRNYVSTEGLPFMVLDNRYGVIGDIE
jgi:predicted O-methyltransferase YrrM